MSDLDKVAEDLGKKFPAKLNDKRVKTKNSEFNSVLGGGIPHPRIITMWGPSGVGKTHLALEIARGFCDEDMFCAYADFEGGMTEDLAKNVVGDYYNDLFKLHKGLADIDDFEELSEAYSNVDMEGLIIVDSMEAVVPLDKDDDGNFRRISDMSIGSKALKDAQLLRKWSALWKKSGISTILVEQQRTAFAGGGYHAYKSDSGAEGVNFYSDLKLRLRNDNSYFDENENHVASDVEVEMEKNKTENLRKGIVQVRFGQGFDPVMTIRQHLLNNEEKLSWFTKKGAGWYTIVKDEDEVKRQGKENLESYIEDNVKWFVERLREEGVIEE